MHIRNGIRTALRAKGRAVLFVLLILVLTLTLTLGVGMWTYCTRLLNSFDESYTSVALAEYIGDDYPDPDAADENAREAFAALNDESIRAVKGVKLWERSDSSMIFPAGYIRASGTVPYSDYGVLVASSLSAMDIGGYTGYVDRVLYNKEVKDGILAVFDAGGTDFVPERGKKYLLHGRFVKISGNHTFVVTDFYDGCETKPWLELSGKDDPAVTDSLFAQMAERYRAANNAATVTASDDIASLEPFQLGTLYLDDGRFPLAGETGVCILSGSTAQRLGAVVGDSVDVTLLNSAPGDRYDLTADEDSRVWKVVGITNTLSDYEGRLWVSGAEGGFAGSLFGYELGRMVLDNRLAVQAVSELEALMPDNVRLTLYDQGYSAAAQPIQAMRSTAAAVTAAAVGVALAVLFLFAYLFVGRQRETVQVLISLGAPGGKIRLWLLSGAALIASAASAAGAVIGHLSLGKVIEQALSLAKSLYNVDIRYSNSVLGSVKEAPKAGAVPLWCSIGAGAAVLVAALLLCLVFLRHARKENVPKKGKTSVRVPRDKTSTFGQGAARFALLSAKRGGWRSFIVPAASLVLALLLGLLAAGASGWQKQLDELYENSTMQGQVISSNGRYATKLTVSAHNARQLWKSGLLSDVSVSMSWNYWFWDEMPYFPPTSFGQEARKSWISRQPEFTAANSLAGIPEFYYTEQPEIQWLEGWDESFLSSTETYSILHCFTYYYAGGHFGGEPIPVYPVIASRAFMDSHGLQLGDETEVMMSMTVRMNGYTPEYELAVPVRIVGSFQPIGQKANLYAPLSFWCDPAWITGGTDILADGERAPVDVSDEQSLNKYFYNLTTFRTCRFTLSSADNLSPFKDFLEKGSYSQVGQLGSNRTTVLLLDHTFQEAVDSLGRYISFGRILFPVLFIVVALMGFIISWLTVNGRRMEFAVLRGLGASQGRVFGSFFLEQGALCLIGSLIGMLALTVIYPLPAVWLAGLGFAVCYLAGAALAIAAVGRTNLMLLLSERE